MKIMSFILILIAFKIAINFINSPFPHFREQQMQIICIEEGI